MYKRSTSEPIAVVGSGCRFAGGATSPSKLWDVLSSPPELSREVPFSRFNLEAFHHHDGEYHGTTNSVRAYWLEQDHRVFDASFFNITPKEAEAIDPQQRLLLEVVYEALESAGYTLPQCSGKDIAVFAGVMTADYDTLSQRDELSASQYYATGNARSIISNRISYFFNFHGPSMTIDTACSSSLVALHQAVLSLRSGESTMACVTGVNLMITPEQFILESSLHMLSPTGKSRMWDVDADGYARGEGVAALFLKPLSRALADGDEIEGLIRETGVNSDGRTKGITMPNPEAQTSLIRSTYRKTGLDPRNPADQCQYFEAHGTGTQVGDPREAAAIDDAFFGLIGDAADHLQPASQFQPRKMLVGSVKTVIGHTEGAAGLAGVLKVLQAMKHGSIPPNLHLNSLNPSVEPFYTHLEIPTSLVPWPETPKGQPRRASVNSFGFGGTNSHAIVEAYEPRIHGDDVGHHFPSLSPTRIRRLHPTPDHGAGTHSFSLPLCLSAYSQKSLRNVVVSLRDYLHAHPHVSINQLSWNLSSRRTALPHRVTISATSRSHALELMESLLDKANSTDIGIRSKSMDGKPQVLGVFTGQGAQWPSMSRSLLLSNRVYRQTIRSLDEVLKACPDPPCWSLEEQILAEKDVSRIHEAAVSQPLCTALQIGLVDVLRSIQISFHTVVGHSSGEIAAAYAAGRLTARDAILISYYRGLFAHLAGGDQGEKGGMLAAGMSEIEALGFCRDPAFDGRICVAASNAPSSVTLSGDLDILHLARDQLTQQKKFARLLLVDTAYHSPHMARPVLEYVKALRRCNISPINGGNGTNWVSSVYGFCRTGENDLAAGYWKDNMIHTVQLHDAVESALSEFGPFDCAVEVGPHPALKGPVNQTIKSVLGTTIPFSGVLDRYKDDSLAFSEFLGFYWSQLGPLSVELCHYIEQSPDPAILDYRLKDLPSYPWDHSQVHYRESRVSRKFHFKTAPPHELLGVRTRDDNDFELRWRNILKTDKVPWLEHHSFQGQALVPASAYCVMALDAARVLLNGRSASIVEIQNLNIMRGISIEADSPGTEVLFSLTVLSPPKDQQSQSAIEARFMLTSCPADGTTTMERNMEGTLRIVLGAASVDALPIRQPCPSETLSASPDAFYRMMDDTGLVYSGPFRALQSIERRFKYSSTSLRRRHSEDSTNLSVSPATLDSCLQSAFLSYASPGDRSLWTSFLPVRIECLRFNLAICETTTEPGSEVTLHVDTCLTNVHPTTSDSKATITVDMGIFNRRGEMEIQIEGLAVSSFANTRPEDDYELHLHTVMDIDPMDEIVQGSIENTPAFDPFVVESCERVASFFIHRQGLHTSRQNPLKNWHYPVIAPGSWPSDTREDINGFISQSPYRVSLELIENLGSVLPDILPATLPLVIEEAHHQFQFNKHVARVVKQVAHRYPRMNVLSLTPPDLSLEEHILSGLEASFLSYTVGSEHGHCGHQHTPESIRQKVHIVSIDPEDDIKAQSEGRTYDLVILSTSILENSDSTGILKNVKASMRDGGFLILIQVSRAPLKDRLRRISGSTSDQYELETPPEWPDVLDACGLTRVAKNSDQFYAPGFSLSVRQADSSRLQLLNQPRGGVGQGLITDSLLIIGGIERGTQQLCRGIQARLALRCRSVSTRVCLEAVDSKTISTCTAAIVLADLDEPVMSNMTEKRLSQFKELFIPNMTILWLTHDARSGDPDHAATFGFTRTITAEVPDLNLQVLDLDQLEGADELIADMFVHLSTPFSAAEGRQRIREPEIHIEKGRRLIPRVMPWRPANDRVNSMRRVVETTVNTLECCVEIAPYRNRVDFVRHEARSAALDISQDPQPGHVLLQVNYSSVDAIKLTSEFCAHICIGRNIATGEPTVALSSANASYVEVPAPQAHAVPNSGVNELRFIQLLNRCLTAHAISFQASQKDVVLIEPDPSLMECVEEVARSAGNRVTSYTTSAKVKGVETSSCIHLHPHASERQVTSIFTDEKGVVFDFLREGNSLSGKIIDLLPDNFEYHTRSSLACSEVRAVIGNFKGAESIWSTSVSMAFQKAAAKPQITENNCPISVPQLLSDRALNLLFQVIDWKAQRNVSQVVRPMSEEHLFHPQKTYVLLGLTRDFGQSLCRLFIQHGAQHIVLASRNPNTMPQWKEELASKHGSNICIEKLDVTNLEDVLAFRAQISESMPPVAGVVNGAMVLEDRVFSQMTMDNWNSVLRPKTVGSKNLDIAFSDDSLDFFVMTSSFAAIGGHPGQANYATANMYMNGLAANRRKRGLVGSVLNIGVIYGLGLLQREKEELYAGLEREGYPAISERDIHHLFLEAIVAGRPGVPNQPYDITTGLSRFKWGTENPLHWHLDPRFSHYTVDDNSGDSAVSVDAGTNLLDQLAVLKDPESMAEAIMVPFFSRLQLLLQLPEGSVNKHQSMSELGVDSLIAVDIRNWIWKALGKDVAVLRLLGASSIYRLCSEISEQIFADRTELESTLGIDTPATSRAPSEAGGQASNDTPVTSSKLVAGLEKGKGRWVENEMVNCRSIYKLDI